MDARRLSVRFAWLVVCVLAVIAPGNAEDDYTPVTFSMVSVSRLWYAAT